MPPDPEQSGMTENAGAPCNGTLRNATTFPLELAAPKSRARAVVEARVLPDIQIYRCLTACGSAAAVPGKTRFNNQSDGWYNTPRVPAPKADPLNASFACSLGLSYPLEYS